MDLRISKIFVFLLMLLTFLHAQPCRQVVYDHYLLALTWPNQFCSQNYCVANWKNNWDGKSLIIHGLWPTSVDLGFLGCLAQHDYDPYCNQPYLYNQYLFTTNQLSQLRTYWPKLSNPRNFWSHEWTRHGNCYLDLIKNKHKSALPIANIFKSYFLQTVKKTKSLAIKLTSSKVSTKADLAKLLKIDVNSFLAICKDDDELDQVRICYSITAQPGKQQIIKCPPSKDKTICKFPIFIK